MRLKVGFIDEVCLGSLMLYVVNREILKPHLSAHSLVGAFLHNHFNDMLLVPAMLPFCLWIYHQLGLRPSEGPATAREIGGHVLLWAFFFEVYGPWILHHGTTDVGDAASYAVGGAISWALWHFPRVWSSLSIFFAFLVGSRIILS